MLKAMKRYCIQTVDRGMGRWVHRKEWMCTIVLSDWSIPRPVSRTQLLEEQQSMYVCTNIADRHTCARFGCGRGREGERETNNEWSIISRFSELLQIIYRSVNSYNYIRILNGWYQLLLADSLTYKSTTLSSQLCKALNLHGEWFIEWAILWSAWGFASSVCITKSM